MVILNNSLDTAHLNWVHSAAPLKPSRIQPEFSYPVIAFNVHVRRLPSIAHIKEKSVWAFSQHYRHSFTPAR